MSWSAVRYGAPRARAVRRERCEFQEQSRTWRRGWNRHWTMRRWGEPRMNPEEAYGWCLWTFREATLAPAWLRDESVADWQRHRALWAFGEIDVCPVFGVPTELCSVVGALSFALGILHRAGVAHHDWLSALGHDEWCHPCDHVIDEGSL